MLNREVGFALNNGHRQPSLSGPKSADFVVKVGCCRWAVSRFVKNGRL
jgi:hypothetical protein